MPGKSSFEFLSVVRWRLPPNGVIVMSGTFSGDEAPSGVAADAFSKGERRPLPVEDCGRAELAGKIVCHPA
jgi:hypothetical protein